jgi:hypothetical protein
MHLTSIREQSIFTNDYKDPTEKKRAHSASPSSSVSKKLKGGLSSLQKQAKLMISNSTQHAGRPEEHRSSLIAPFFDKKISTATKQLEKKNALTLLVGMYDDDFR